MVMMAMDKRGHIEITGYGDETRVVKENLGSPEARHSEQNRAQLNPA
jgi:hypothetical protein